MLWEIFKKIDILLASFGNISFENIYREANSFADAMAKGGIDRNNIFLIT